MFVFVLRAVYAVRFNLSRIFRLSHTVAVRRIADHLVKFRLDLDPGYRSCRRQKALTRCLLGHMRPGEADSMFEERGSAAFSLDKQVMILRILQDDERYREWYPKIWDSIFGRLARYKGEERILREPTLRNFIRSQVGLSISREWELAPA